MSLLIYQLLLPVYVLVAFPGWLVKMAKRGGLGSGLLERVTYYNEELEYEPLGAVHLHAVSVGETLLAIKLIKKWKEREPDERFVLAIATATGHAVAIDADIEDLRVVYQPLDFNICVHRYLKRFEPKAIVLVEGEMWPNLMSTCQSSGIPVCLVNARMSPRSRKRYQKFADWIRPVFSKLKGVALQDEEHADIWESLGVRSENISPTGSLKFDTAGAAESARRPEFAAMIDTCSGGRKVVLASSTHAGEEVLIGRAVLDAGAFYLCVPRHAERRDSVKADLERGGHNVVLRSSFEDPQTEAALVVDTTGELRDWVAHADVVVIGKSFLGVGGQSPAEAIRASVPVIFGPDMSNFEPLASRLVASGGVIQVGAADDLSRAIIDLLNGTKTPDTGKALEILKNHDGATDRIIDFVKSRMSQDDGIQLCDSAEAS